MGFCDTYSKWLLGGKGGKGLTAGSVVKGVFTFPAVAFCVVSDTVSSKPSK